MYTEVNINQCTYQAAGNPASDPAVPCDDEAKCIKELGAGFTCVQNVCIKTGGDATIAGVAGQGTADNVPVVPVAALGNSGAPGGIGTVTFSAWRNSYNGEITPPESDVPIVPVGGVTLTLTGKPLKSADTKLAGLVAEEGFANNESCSFWQNNVFNFLFGGSERHTIITPDNGLTGSKTQVLGLPAGTYILSAKKNSFIMPNTKNPTGDNKICFNVTKDSKTEVKVLLLAQPSQAEPPGINAEVIYQKPKNAKPRFFSVGKKSQYQYMPEAPYYGWQKIDKNKTNLGYNSERPIVFTAEGGMTPGISVGLGMPGRSMQGFINLCQGISLTVGTKNLTDTEKILMTAGGFATALLGKDNSMIKNLGMLLGVSGAVGLMGSDTDVTINLNDVGQKCAAFNQLGIPPQCNICLSNPNLCPQGCWAYSAQFQMLSQMKDFF